MDVLDAIRARKSIRGYKPDPVPKEVLSQILDVARHAPSAMNTQPWEITVITGDVLASISKENGLYPYDWTDRVRRVWRDNPLFSSISTNLSKSFGER